MATPRKDRAGVHSIDHFALEVPDLEAARKFFSAFGHVGVHAAVWVVFWLAFWIAVLVAAVKFVAALVRTVQE